MTKGQELFQQAQEYYVGGVDAANRYHGIMGSTLYLDHAKGSRMFDVDGNEYLDFHTSAGAALFGYDHPRIMAAAQEAIRRGAFMNYNTTFHIELAQLMRERIPCAEKIRFGNTGTEVTQAAIRLARGYTGKDICIRMEGHFHGMHELIWYNHNRMAKMDEIGEVEASPDSAGFPKSFSDVLKNVEFNDFDALQRVYQRYKGNVACIIMEPISFNCGCYPARKAYLEQVRAFCTQENIVLIFDEVITGLRLRPGTAQGYYGVTPDLATFAKAIGGTFPLAALCGKNDVMNALAPIGKVGMSGTYTGALMPVLASIECFKMAAEPGFYDDIEKKANALYGGINDLYKKHGIKGHCNGFGARFGMFFGIEDPETDFNWRNVIAQYDLPRHKAFVKRALELGMYFVDPGNGPVPCHCGFSTQHTMEDIAEALEKMDTIFAEIR